MALDLNALGTDPVGEAPAAGSESIRAGTALALPPPSRGRLANR